jgi:predicted membrane protein
MEWALQPEQIGRSVLLLFLGMFGGVISSGLTNCGIMKAVREVIYVKHLIFFLLIIFAVGFAKDTPRTTGTIIWNALLIYIGFMLLMRSEPVMAVLTVIALVVMFVSLEARKFGLVGGEEESSGLDPLVTTMAAFAGAFLFVGFVWYLVKQYDDHKHEGFNFVKFFFGTNRCSRTA